MSSFKHDDDNEDSSSIRSNDDDDDDDDGDDDDTNLPQVAPSTLRLHCQSFASQSSPSLSRLQPFKMGKLEFVEKMIFSNCVHPGCNLFKREKLEFVENMILL